MLWAKCIVMSLTKVGKSPTEAKMVLTYLRVANRTEEASQEEAQEAPILKAGVLTVYPIPGLGKLWAGTARGLQAGRTPLLPHLTRLSLCCGVWAVCGM